MEKDGLERYSYSSGLTLPLLASDTPVLPSGADALDAFGLRFFGVGDGVQVRCTCLIPEKRSAGERRNVPPRSI